MLLGKIIFGSCLDLIFFNDINVYNVLDIDFGKNKFFFFYI